jgi:cholesterol transport system auxiliary component
VSGDLRLVLDIRRFESDYAGGATPNAVIEVNAKLLDAQDRDVVASRTFLCSEPAGGTDVPQVVDAFERGLGGVTRDIALWTLGRGRG